MIEARGLDAGFGPKRVLHALSFCIPPGVSFAVVGPGGSGKSVLLKVLARTPEEGLWTSGRLRTPDAPLPLLPQKTREIPARSASYSRARLDHLGAFLEATRGACLLDEPEAGTRDDEHAEVIALLHRARGSRTMIVVSHDLELVRQSSDFMMLLVDGEIIELGETAAIFGAPAKERTRHYLRMGS